MRWHSCVFKPAYWAAINVGPRPAQNTWYDHCIWGLWLGYTLQKILYVSVIILTIESFYRTLCIVCCVIRLKFRFQVATNSGLSESGNGIFSSQSLAYSGLEKRIDKNQIQQPPSKSEGIFTCNLKLRNNNLWQFGIAQRQICHSSKKLLHNVWIINREQSA